ncbi:alginate lyase family protein [Solidesulfovibrio sp.]|uniref:alginate lyase family protein n=1 Tax=Solidesulfovibrio sp. TaxID=2910990 RepID=UPI002B2006CF|nr:alginate lyase family protein [Solidesulfovibrio sp.]MEA5090211.1 alginate lyase family protein [Solidesulfovibrio sp.]
MPRRPRVGAACPRRLWLLFALLLLGATRALAGSDADRLLFSSHDVLVAAREAAAAGDPALAPALARLREECADAMAAGPFTVTAKTTPPPGGDVHDYASLAPYWWPDPDKPDGLPPLHRDGEVYPPSRQGDVARLESLSENVCALALGYWYTGDEAMAGRASLLLRTFFLDPATAMRPHLRFAQMTPGKAQGSGFGIIDARRLPEVCDAATLLSGSRAWSEADMAGLRAWVAAYLDWLLESPQGRQAREARNNQGSWYDVQVAGCALFCGRPQQAREALARFPERVAAQIAPDGAQPLELARTRSLSYSLSNLEALFRLMLLGDRLGLDLWHAAATDKGGPRRALEFLMPYLGQGAPWPYEQITPVGHAQGQALLLRLAALHYGDPAYGAAFDRVFGKKGAKRRVWLLYPAQPGGRFEAAAVSPTPPPRQPDLWPPG